MTTAIYFDGSSQLRGDVIFISSPLLLTASQDYLICSFLFDLK